MSSYLYHCQLQGTECFVGKFHRCYDYLRYILSHAQVRLEDLGRRKYRPEDCKVEKLEETGAASALTDKVTTSSFLDNLTIKSARIFALSGLEQCVHGFHAASWAT